MRKPTEQQRQHDEDGGVASSAAMTYRAQLSERVLRQLGNLPAKAFGAVIATMATVVDYPNDPLRTFTTSDPYVRRAFGELGLVTDVIDHARRTVTLTAVTWIG